MLLLCGYMYGQVPNRATHHIFFVASDSDVTSLGIKFGNFFNPFQANVPFLYPLKTSEN